MGTQMIVKGHDFPKVTVVGNILADLSLFDTDFESSERTFDLLTQAAGRAGRAGLPEVWLSRPTSLIIMLLNVHRIRIIKDFMNMKCPIESFCIILPFMILWRY